MSEVLSPTPSLLEEHDTKKRLIQKWITETRLQPPIDAFAPPSMPATSVLGSPTEPYPPTEQALSNGNVTQSSGYTVIVNPPANWGPAGLQGGVSRSPAPQYVANQPPVPGPMPVLPSTVISVPAPLTTNANIEKATASMPYMKINPSGTMAQVYSQDMNTATAMYPSNTIQTPINTTITGNKATISAHVPGAIAYTNPFPYHLPETQVQLMATSTRHSQRSHQPATYHHSSGRSRPMHRTDIDNSGDTTRSRTAAEPVSLPPDYVPASPGPERQPEHSRSRRTSVPPPTAISGSHSGRHGNHGVNPVVGHNDSLTLPYTHGISHVTKHHDSTPHHRHHGHHHSYHHHDRDHTPSRHRSSSTHAPPVHHYPQIARPVFNRHRSRSVDAGNPRMTRSRPNETYPAQTQAPQSQYYAHQSGAQSPTNTTGTGNYHVLHPSPTSPTVIQPPTHQPVVVPMGDGSRGWVVVPPQGQSVRVVHGHHAGSTEKDSRGRSTAPGFFSRLFGRRAQSSSAAQAVVYPAESRYHHNTARPVQYVSSRPKVLRRRSSR